MKPWELVMAEIPMCHCAPELGPGRAGWILRRSGQVHQMELVFEG